VPAGVCRRDIPRAIAGRPNRECRQTPGLYDCQRRPPGGPGALLDGADLREYDTESLRRNLGVIFQDFVQYEFVSKENIGAWNIERVAAEPAIKTAAERSLPDSVAQRLAGRYDPRFRATKVAARHGVAALRYIPLRRYLKTLQ